jgi:Zn-dependent M32 family carboxypeptidase
MRYLKQRDSFLNEDMNLAKSIISKKMNDFEKLKELLKNNLGYIGKFTQFLMEENIPLNELETLYKDLLNLKEKQLAFDFNKMTYEKVLDKIQSSKEDLSINSLISQMPSEQKKIAKEILKDSKKLILTVSKKENLENSSKVYLLKLKILPFQKK